MLHEPAASDEGGRPYDPARLLVSLHVPKTAGTSLRAALSRWFGSDLVLHYRDREVPPARAAARPGLCVHGHFNRLRGIGALEYYPEASQFIVFLRNPFDRFVSQWLYLHYQRRAGFHVPELADEPSFERWLDTRREAAEDGEDPFGVSAQLPRPMRAGAVAFGPEYIFVGLTERYAESLERLARVMGRPPSEALHLNTVRDIGRSRDAQADFSQHRARHESGFALEYELYAAAERRFALEPAAARLAA